jgi:hypothetical protein
LVFAAETSAVGRSDVPAAGRTELSAVSHGA